MKLIENKIIEINHIIREQFQNNYIIETKNYSYRGHEYLSDDFIFEKKIEIFFKSKPQISIRFLCDIQIFEKTYSKKDFFDKIHAYKKSPIFVLIPYYFKTLDKTSEPCVAYTAKCEFFINYNIKTKNFSLLAKKYVHSTNFNLLKDRIKNVLFEENYKTKLDQISLKKNIHKYNQKGVRSKNILTSFKQQIMKSKPYLISSIQSIMSHMQKGDCYLANLTYRHFDKENKKHFDSCCFIKNWFKQKSSFGYFFFQNDIALESYSPERFLIRKKNKIGTQPIKGTALLDTKKTLWSNQKEMTEHTMVVDLLRHDLNAVCIPGSVIVQKPFFLKECHSIFQMQSSILGELNPNINLSKIFMSLLPGGSISGTPKKRVCELIKTHESSQRGYYTGVSGIIEKNKNFDLALLIRSWFKGKLGIYAGVGAGITTLSSPKEEFREFCLKFKTFS